VLSSSLATWPSPKSVSMPTKKEGKWKDIDDIVLERYEMSSQVGQGAYGIVYKATDKRTGEKVAVKKTTGRVLANKAEAHRTLREVCILQTIGATGGHPYIVHLQNVMKPAQNEFDLYLIFECLDGDMRTAIKGMVFQTHKDILRCIVQVQVHWRILSSEGSSTAI